MGVPSAMARHAGATAHTNIIIRNTTTAATATTATATAHIKEKPSGDRESNMKPHSTGIRSNLLLQLCFLLTVLLSP